MKPLLANGDVLVNNQIARDAAQVIGPFDAVSVKGEVLQNNTPVYLMLHKPKGVICATKDEVHKTVIDLIEHPQKNELHIVGRLDRSSTGLVLLTNDGCWSKQLMQPNAHVEKHYQVTLQSPLSVEYVTAFAQGMYFGYENVTLKPVKLTITSPFTADLVLLEGKYHQIKRMFGRFRNPVLGLHRTQIGSFKLGHCLAEGQWKTVLPE